MVTYALLGATGGTGSAILRSLVSKPPLDLKLNILVRSPDKLRKQLPDVDSTSAFKSNVIHGTPSDTSALRQCLTDADVIIVCLGSNVSKPGMSVVHDTADAIVKVLQDLRQTKGSKAYKTPTLLQLRSLSINDAMKYNTGFVGRTVAGFCFHYAYIDIQRACDVFDSAAAGTPGLLTTIWVDPPAIHDPEGTTPTGYALITEGTPGSIISYSDLGAAFCELAERRKEFVGKAVAPYATGEVNETWDILKGYMWIAVKSRIWG